MKRKSKLGDYFARFPHCSTLYALFQHVNLQKVATVACGSCEKTFIVSHHLTEPNKKVVIPDNNPYLAKLSPVESANSKTNKRYNFTKIKWSWMGALTGIFLAFALMIGSYVGLNGGPIAQSPLLYGWWVSLCAALGCNPGSTINPSEIKVEQHELVGDPADSTKLQLHAIIKNTSNFPQPLGKLQMQIQDLEGKPIKMLTFSPNEYAPNVNNKLLKPDQTLSIAITLNQPTPDLFSYKLNFI